VNFELSEEQQMLRDAAKDALSRLDTVASAREALDGAPLLDIWPTAREAGWTGLLLPEEHGGAGLDAFDAMLVLEECGRGLTGAGLIGHLTACEVLRRSTGVDPDLLGALGTGEKRAAFVAARPPAVGERWTVDARLGSTRAPAPVAVVEDGRAGVSGSVAFVPDLSGADVLVVAAADPGEAPAAVLLDAGAAGVAIEPVVRFDASRPLGHLDLDGAVGVPLDGGPEALAAAWFLGQALLAADALGVSEAMLELGVSYAKDRHAFGRPIGSYQAVKHMLVEIMRSADRVRNLCYFTGFAAQSRPEELALAASSARFAGEQAADQATRTCIAVHGGIGNTWEHDAPFYWRRAQLSRLLLGGIADAGDRVAAEVIATARAA
jgi:alkylation response protein AidB-like acyl-CoA dehydrogenase